MGLSIGQHTLNLRFTPEGSTTPSLTQRVTFSVSADPTTCEYRNRIIVTIKSFFIYYRRVVVSITIIVFLGDLL